MNGREQTRDCDRAKSTPRRLRFVRDGAERMAKGIRSHAYPEIEAAVNAEYADRFRAAGFLQRIRLRWRIRLEINRRVSREIADRLPSEDVLW